MPVSVFTDYVAYFYPRSPCGERLRVLDGSKSSIEISIHALLAESDCFFCVKLLSRLIFLSTLSLRRATSHQEWSGSQQPISIHALLAESDEVSGDTWQLGSNFYPRSPCGERHGRRLLPKRGHRISIHALLAESDCTAAGRPV